MPPRDLVLIGLVVLAWGSNFTAMKLALEELPPLLFVGLRFAILLPLLAVLKRPALAWWKILAVGALINMGQFAFLFSALRADATAGLGSLLIQMQAPLDELGVGHAPLHGKRSGLFLVHKPAGVGGTV